MNLLTQIFVAFCGASWRASCLIALFLPIRPLVRGRVATRIVFWAWIVVALRLVIPFSAPARWSPFGSPWVTLQSNAAARHSIPATYRSEGQEPANIATENHVVSSETKSGGTKAQRGPLGLMQWASLIWLAGVVVLAGARVAAAHRFTRRLRRTSSIPDPALEAVIAIVGTKLGIPKCAVLESDHVSVPAVHGLLRPKLLFPPRFSTQLNAKELPFVVAHELGHCRHRDLLSHTLIHAAQILHWFNPFVWIAAGAAKGDCEIACDEFALGRLGDVDRSAYGATLLKVLQSVSQFHPLSASLGIVDSRKHIKRRLQMIAEYKPIASSRTLLGSALLAALFTVGMTRPSNAQQPSPPTTPGITTEAPHGWWKNGNKPAAYEVGVDHVHTHAGAPSAYVKSLKPSVKGFGGMMQECSADDYRGKRVRFSAWVKSKNARDGGAHLWFRVDGHSRMLGFDNLHKRAVTGTKDWTHCSIVLDVPKDAVDLAYGFFIDGTGQAWVSNMKIEEVGKNIPTTNMLPLVEKRLPKRPVNLSLD